MRNFIFLFTFFGTFSAMGQEADSTVTACSNYKTGEFYVLNGTDTCFITRTKDRQTESCNTSDESYQLIVVWLSDKKYILRDIHYNPSTAPRVMRKDVIMKVTEIGSNYYKVLAKTKGRPSEILTVYCNQ